MIGSLLRLCALEEFHATLSEMFVSHSSLEQALPKLKRLNDYCQKLQRTALAAESVCDKGVVWMKVHSAIVFKSGLENEIQYELDKFNRTIERIYHLPDKDIYEKEFSMAFFDRVNEKVSGI